MSSKSLLDMLNETELAMSFPLRASVDIFFVRMFAEISFFAVGPWLHDHIHKQLKAVDQWSIHRDAALKEFGDNQRSLL